MEYVEERRWVLLGRGSAVLRPGTAETLTRQAEKSGGGGNLLIYKAFSVPKCVSGEAGRADDASGACGSQSRPQEPALPEVRRKATGHHSGCQGQGQSASGRIPPPRKIVPNQLVESDAGHPPGAPISTTRCLPAAIPARARAWTVRRSGRIRPPEENGASRRCYAVGVTAFMNTEGRK